MTDVDLLASLGRGQLMVIGVGAAWCVYTRVLTPRLATLADHFKDRVVVTQIDLAQGKHLANDFNVLFVPAVVVLNHGRVLQRSYGAELNVPRMTEFLEAELQLEGR
jgi:thioredoxin 2